MLCERAFTLNSEWVTEWLSGLPTKIILIFDKFHNKKSIKLSLALINSTYLNFFCKMFLLIKRHVKYLQWVLNLHMRNYIL